MLNWLIETALRNRLVVVVVALASAAAGALALAHLDIDAFPDTTPAQVQVNVTATALAAEEVEQQITAPLEQALGGLPKLESLRSVSKFGLSQVVVTFADGTDVYFARQLVTERLNAVELPAGIDRPTLGPVATGLGEIFHYVVRLKDGDPAALPDAERVERLNYLRTVHDWSVKPKLRAVPGVAEVNSWGGCEKQCLVRPDPDRLIARGLQFADVAAALERHNRNAGGGSVTGNDRLLPVHGIGRTTTLAEVGAITVSTADGVPTLLRDVADVEYGAEVRRGSVTAMGGGEAVLGLCFMTMGENSKAVAEALGRKLAEITPTLPPDVTVEVVYDRTELVQHVIATVRRNLFEGGLLVIAVLFAFLGNLRAAAVVAVAIPLSLLLAFAGMWRFGIAASLLSLGALDFGMVVDSSVVMVENCVRHIAHGDLRKRTMVEVIRDAAVEVRKPTLFGELIIMIVYLPILTLEGTEGKLFRPMALTVIFALLGSMLLSLTLMPVLASLVLPMKIRERQPLLMRLAHALHAPVLKLCMDHRFAVVSVAGCLAFVAFGLIAPRLGTEFVPRLSEGSVAIGVVRLAGTDLRASNDLNTRMERMLIAAFPDEVKHVWSRVGTAEIATDPMGVELTDMFVTFHPRPRWTKAATQAELTEQIQRLLRGIPGQRIAFSQPIEMRMNEMVSGVRSDLGVILYGDDLATLTERAKAIADVLKGIDGSADVAVEAVTGQPGLQVRVKPDEAARYGVPVQAVLDAVRALASLPAGEVVEGQLRYPLAVRWPERFRTGPDAVASIPVSAPGGAWLPLGRLATVKVAEGPSTITRDWGQRRITVTCNIRGRDLGGFVADAKEALKPVEAKLPRGRYWLQYGGQFEHYERARARLTLVVPVAVLLIFGLLVATYRNATDALRVLTGVPFGWVGGLFALWLRDMPLSISAVVGFIALSGVAVLDDMILVSTVRQFRRRGLGVHDAVREAAITRLRPVLMTTLVASLGFLPMALSTGQGAEVQRPLATVVIGGVVGAMVMSLLVLRVLYLVFDALAHGAHWAATRVLGVRPAASAAVWGIEEEPR